MKPAIGFLTPPRVRGGQAAFECCRLNYGASHNPFDSSDFMLGWEMQTGVMAYKRGPRLDAFCARSPSAPGRAAARSDLPATHAACRDPPAVECLVEGRARQGRRPRKSTSATSRRGRRP